MEVRITPDGTRAMALSVFVHYEASGSILHVCSTRPKPEDVEPGDVIVRQVAWIADIPFVPEAKP